MSDEEKRSADNSSGESMKSSSKRLNTDSNELLPKRPRMNLWENQNKNQPVTNKDDNSKNMETDDSETDKSSDFEVDDETSLEELAATICGLTHSELYCDELDMFPWLITQPESVKSVYFYIRNRACMVWLKDPKVQLSEKTLLQSINSSSSDKYFHDVIAAKLCSYQKNEDVANSKNQNKSANNDKSALKKFDIDAILKDNVYKENISKLATMSIAFLERSGFANIGCFTKQNDSITNGSVCGNNASPLQVIVIGAGLSGIMTALQLQYFGCKVLVLEAKEVPGGRLQTFKEGSWQADTSPFSITGINNPVNQLIKQSGLAVTFFNNEVDIVNAEGDPVLKESVSRIECELNRLLLAAHDICSKFPINNFDKKHISLGEMLDALLSLQTLHCKNLKKNSNALIIKLMNRLQEVIVEMEQHKTAVADAHKKWCDAEEESKNMRKEESSKSKKDAEVKEEAKEVSNDTLNTSPTIISVDLRADTSNDEEENVDKAEPKKVLIINPSQQMKVNLALSEYRKVFKQCVPIFEEAIKIRKMIKLIQEYDPSSMLLDQQDMQIMDWFMGNIELRSGTRLNNLSLKQSGSQDPMLDLISGEILIKKGYHALVNALVKKSNVFQYNSIVKEVSYTNDGVLVTTLNTALSEDEPVFYNSDVVISTLPLGVLKESINNPSGTNAPQFIPPLPDWKKNSINALGFGIFDKVIMCFKERFWGTSKSKMFVQLKSDSTIRGEFIQFYAFSNRSRNEDGSDDSIDSSDSEENNQVETTVVAIICGQAALQYFSQSHLTDQEIGKRTLSALRNVFRKKKVTVPEPEKISVCRWSKDIFTRGVFSYIPEGSSLSDVANVYAPLPVYEPPETSQKQRKNTAINHASLPRLFFAGEHCYLGGIGTIQASMMSGLKVAAEIAKLYFPQLPNLLNKLPGSLQFRK